MKRPLFSVCRLLLLATLNAPAAFAADPNAADLAITAQIRDNTCTIRLDNNGYVRLPVIHRTELVDGDGNPRLSPTDNSGGKAFRITVTDCMENAGGGATGLHFAFSPYALPVQNQVFPNETAPADGGAQGVGMVVFSRRHGTNVLNTDGSSDVVFPSEGNMLKDYLFTVRYQGMGPVTSGLVTSRVRVDVTYD
ncbi:fimbrial-like protein [Chimaeribacter californicus]|uniref:fimbrial-like protein n=1 Tax=Chimaeribacter californicus TaxID=2060067 RepID=UPI0013FCF9FA|nr:fimbrial-like protein [Chimaeribacter californicus]